MKKIIFPTLCFLVLSLSTQAQNWNIEERQASRESGVSYLHEEMQKSGLSPLNVFLQFGSAGLQNKLATAEENLRRADPFDRADAQAKVDAVKKEIETALAEIAKKTFYGEYGYSAPLDLVKVDGNKSISGA